MCRAPPRLLPRATGPGEEVKTGGTGFQPVCRIVDLAKPFTGVKNPCHAMPEVVDRHLAQRTPGKRPPAYSMRALGSKNLPETILLDGRRWTLTRTHKHDFWAVTGFYESATGERAVLKMGQTEPFAGVPLAWVGRYLCRREVRFYQALSDLPNVPKILGRIGTTGFLHEYVPGAPLSKDRPVPDQFF